MKDTMNSFASVGILDVWRALGGGEIRRGRSKAFWRGGDNPTAIAIDAELNRWHDFVQGRGGGPLQLVEVSVGCSRIEALRWLEAQGLIEPRRQLSLAERRVYAERLEVARREAALALSWRLERLHELNLAKLRAYDTHDFALLEVAARAEFSLATADADGVLKLFREHRRHAPLGFAQTMHAAAEEAKVWQRLEEAAARGSSAPLTAAI